MVVIKDLIFHHQNYSQMCAFALAKLEVVILCPGINQWTTVRGVTKKKDISSRDKDTKTGNDIRKEQLTGYESYSTVQYSSDYHERLVL